MTITRLRASLIICNVPTTNSDAARRFYGTLLGSEDFARGLNDEVESYFIPISEDGIDLNVTQRFDDQERLTCYFAVDDLASTLKELSSLDGRVVVPERKVKIGPQKALRFFQEFAKREGLEIGDSIGTMAVILDPDGNHVGLMQLEAIGQKHFKVGKYRNSLDDEQTAEHDLAISAGHDVA